VTHQRRKNASVLSHHAHRRAAFPVRFEGSPPVLLAIPQAKRALTRANMHALRTCGAVRSRPTATMIPFLQKILDTTLVRPSETTSIGQPIRAPEPRSENTE
jgi:hypothetical protein